MIHYRDSTQQSPWWSTRCLFFVGFVSESDICVFRHWERAEIGRTAQCTGTVKYEIVPLGVNTFCCKSHLNDWITRQMWKKSTAGFLRQNAAIFWAVDELRNSFFHKSIALFFLITPFIESLHNPMCNNFEPGSNNLNWMCSCDDNMFMLYNTRVYQITVSPLVGPTDNREVPRSADYEYEYVWVSRILTRWLSVPRRICWQNECEYEYIFRVGRMKLAALLLFFSFPFWALSNNLDKTQKWTNSSLRPCS